MLNKNATRYVFAISIMLFASVIVCSLLVKCNNHELWLLIEKDDFEIYNATINMRSYEELLHISRSATVRGNALYKSGIIIEKNCVLRIDAGSSIVLGASGGWIHNEGVLEINGTIEQPVKLYNCGGIIGSGIINISNSIIECNGVPTHTRPPVRAMIESLSDDVPIVSSSPPYDNYTGKRRWVPMYYFEGIEVSIHSTIVRMPDTINHLGINSDIVNICESTFIKGWFAYQKYRNDMLEDGDNYYVQYYPYMNKPFIRCNVGQINNSSFEGLSGSFIDCQRAEIKGCLFQNCTGAELFSLGMNVEVKKCVFISSYVCIFQGLFTECIFLYSAINIYEYVNAPIKIKGDITGCLIYMCTVKSRPFCQIMISAFCRPVGLIKRKWHHVQLWVTKEIINSIYRNEQDLYCCVIVKSKIDHNVVNRIKYCVYAGEINERINESCIAIRQEEGGMYAFYILKHNQEHNENEMNKLSSLQEEYTSTALFVCDYYINNISCISHGMKEKEIKICNEIKQMIECALRQIEK